jgi:hypothetical protein
MPESRTVVPVDDKDAYQESAWTSNLSAQSGQSRRAQQRMPSAFALIASHTVTRLCRFCSWLPRCLSLREDTPMRLLTRRAIATVGEKFTNNRTCSGCHPKARQEVA